MNVKLMGELTFGRNKFRTTHPSSDGIVPPVVEVPLTEQAVLSGETRQNEVVLIPQLIRMRVVVVHVAADGGSIRGGGTGEGASARYASVLVGPLEGRFTKKGSRHVEGDEELEPAVEGQGRRIRIGDSFRLPCDWQKRDTA